MSLIPIIYSASMQMFLWTGHRAVCCLVYEHDHFPQDTRSQEGLRIYGSNAVPGTLEIFKKYLMNEWIDK